MQERGGGGGGQKREREKEEKQTIQDTNMLKSSKQIKHE